MQHQDTHDMFFEDRRKNQLPKILKAIAAGAGLIATALGGASLYERNTLNEWDALARTLPEKIARGEVSGPYGAEAISHETLNEIKEARQDASRIKFRLGEYTRLQHDLSWDVLQAKAKGLTNNGQYLNSHRSQ